MFSLVFPHGGFLFQVKDMLTFRNNQTVILITKVIWTIFVLNIISCLTFAKT